MPLDSWRLGPKSDIFRQNFTKQLGEFSDIFFLGGGGHLRPEIPRHILGSWLCVKFLVVPVCEVLSSILACCNFFLNRQCNCSISVHMVNLVW